MFNNDYYPFGMLMPNRHESSDKYRYGFQGQEKDDKVKGEGNSINYKFRMHDPRVGRFFAVDPLIKKYPHYSSYSFSGNKVIAFVELEGLEDFYNLNLGDINKGYNVMLVVPTKRDRIVQMDYEMAMKNNIPIMEIENFEQFEIGLTELYKRNISINTVVSTSHGNAAYTKFGKDVLNTGIDYKGVEEYEAKDLPNLKSLVGAKYFVFISCSMAKIDKTPNGRLADGEKLLKDAAIQTNTTTIGSLHNVSAGKEFDGEETFNGGTFTWEGILPEFNRDPDKDKYTKVTPTGQISTVKNLTIDKDKSEPVNYDEDEK